jgi:hypothetical protein
MPTPQNLFDIFYQQSSLDGEFRLRVMVRILAFHSIDIPTAISSPFSKMNMRRMRMIVREQKNAISLET